MYVDECDEDAQVKVRKPYTITKSRESWTGDEHNKFLEALMKFGRNWKKIEASVGTKTVIQIRGHAQKYFLKMEKNGTVGNLPPPRPKRKAVHPYPQKATTTIKKPLARSNNFPEQDTNGARFSSVNHPPVSTTQKSTTTSFLSSQDDEMPGTSCDWQASASGMMPADKCTGPFMHPPVKADEGTVCRHLASVFDPTATDHLERFKALTPCNREAVLARLSTLVSNLSPENSLELVKLLPFTVVSLGTLADLALTSEQVQLINVLRPSR